MYCKVLAHQIIQKPSQISSIDGTPIIEITTIHRLKNALYEKK